MGNQCCSYKSYTESINVLHRNSTPQLQESILKSNNKTPHNFDNRENEEVEKGFKRNEKVDDKEELLNSKMLASDGFSPSLNPNGDKVKHISMESTFTINYRIDWETKKRRRTQPKVQYT